MKATKRKTPAAATYGVDPKAPVNLAAHFGDCKPFTPRKRGLNLTFAKSTVTKQNTVPPSAEDLNRVAKQIADVLQIARDHFGEVAFTHSERDLEILQRILDNRILDATDKQELQSLGLVFGDVLARKADLRWVTVQDALGRDPALQFRNTSLILFPLTMISKRVEDGQHVDVADLMKSMEKEVANLKEEIIQNEKFAGAKPWWKFW